MIFWTAWSLSPVNLTNPPIVMILDLPKLIVPSALNLYKRWSYIADWELDGGFVLWGDDFIGVVTLSGKIDVG